VDPNDLPHEHVVVGNDDCQGERLADALPEGADEAEAGREGGEVAGVEVPLGLADAELVLEGAGVDLVGGDVEAEQGRSGVEDSRRVVEGAGGLVGERGEGAGHPGGALANVEALVVGLSGAPNGSPGASGHQEKDRDRS
jgi:hypothetical protein